MTARWVSIISTDARFCCAAGGQRLLCGHGGSADNPRGKAGLGWGIMPGWVRGTASAPPDRPHRHHCPHTAGAIFRSNRDTGLLITLAAILAASPDQRNASGLRETASTTCHGCFSGR